MLQETSIGDYRIHRFDFIGNYVTPYGEGQGMGPVLDFDIIGDASVYMYEYMDGGMKSA